METFPLPIYDKTLRKFLHNANPNFSDAQLDNAARVCQGLIAPLPHTSLSSIARSLLEPRDQSSLNRFLTESDWGAEVQGIERNKVLFMQQHRQTAMTSRGVISLDDTLLEKTGSAMDLVNEHFDHCSFTMKRGTSVVSMNYCDSSKNFNLFKKVYVRKKNLAEKGKSHRFKTKIELACGMLENLVKTVPSIISVRPHVVFDSWFLAKDITALLDDHKLKYVSRAKSNRKIKGLDMNVKEYAANVLKDSDFEETSVEGYSSKITVYCTSSILPISKLGDVKVVFLKTKQESDVSCFLVSNDLKLSMKEIIELYKARWGIETDYKVNKQDLGLSECHLRGKEGILRYLTLVFLASTYLEYYRLMGLFGRHFGKDVDLSTKGKVIRAYRHLMFECFLIWVDAQLFSGKDIFDLLSYFRDDSLRCQEGLEFGYNSTHLALICNAG
ncbi:MAG: transposase [Promethearchaeota archaeon]